MKVVFSLQLFEKITSLAIPYIILRHSTPSDFAEWTLLITSASILVSVTTIGVTNLIINHLNLDQIHNLIKSKATLKYTLSVTIIIGILIISNDYYSENIFYQKINMATLVLILLFIGIEILSEIIVSIQRSLLNHVGASISSYQRTLFKLLAILAVINLGEYELNKILIIVISAEITYCLIALNKLKNKSTFGKSDTEQRIDLFRILKLNYSLVLIYTFGNLAYSLLNFIDRLLIKRYLNPVDVTAYTLYLSLSGVLTLIYVSKNFVSYPRLAYKKKTSQKRIKISLIETNYFAALSSVLVLIWGKQLIGFISSEIVTFEPFISSMVLINATLFGIHINLASERLVSGDYGKIVFRVTGVLILNIIFSILVGNMYSLNLAVIINFICNLILVLVTFKQENFKHLLHFPNQYFALFRKKIFFVCCWIAPIAIAFFSSDFSIAIKLIETMLFLLISWFVYWKLMEKWKANDA